MYFFPVRCKKKKNRPGDEATAALDSVAIYKLLAVTVRNSSKCQGKRLLEICGCG